MREVVVLGIGSTEFGYRPDMGITDLAVEACRKAFLDAGCDRKDIEALYLGNFAGESLVNQGMLASVVASHLGVTGIPALRVEGACASGGLAAHQGIQNVASGVHDMVLVVGVEKMTSATTAQVTQALASAGEQEREMRTGLTFPSMFGMIMRAHMEQYGTTREEIASVSVKNREFGIKNPLAHFRKPTTVEDVIESRLIGDPIRLFDCPPISDGGTAMIFCTKERAADFSSAQAISVIGAAQASGPSTLFEMSDITSLPATVQASQAAYAQAGVTPSEIDVVELHDCFTISEIIEVEDLGFVKKGEGGSATAAGFTRGEGGPVVNPSGGLLSKGHPVGATGCSQIYEIVKQLRGDASNQVKDARIGLAYNMGGTGAVATAAVFSN